MLKMETLLSILFFMDQPWTIVQGLNLSMDFHAKAMHIHAPTMD
jgi:hypothetical protein